MSIVITYRLSEAAQRNELKEGRDGSRDRTLTVEQGEPEYAALLDHAQVDEQGEGRISQIRAHERGHACYIRHEEVSFDSLQTAASLLEAITNSKRLLAELEAQVASYEAEKRAEEEAGRLDRQAQIDEWLAQRPTKTTLYEAQGKVDGKPWGSGVKYPYREPKDPFPTWWEYEGREEWKRWKAELKGENDAAEAAAQQVADAKAAKEQAKRDAAQKVAAAAEAKRRQDLGVADGDWWSPLVKQALTRAPRWSAADDARNWLAAIEINPRSPGGLGRKFLEAAKGKYYYILSDEIQAGTPVEFGSGPYGKSRWYGYVVRRAEDHVVLRPAATAEDAIAEGDALAKVEQAETPAVAV